MLNKLTLNAKMLVVFITPVAAACFLLGNEIVETYQSYQTYEKMEVAVSAIRPAMELASATRKERGMTTAFLTSNGGSAQKQTLIAQRPNVDKKLTDLLPLLKKIEALHINADINEQLGKIKAGYQSLEKARAQADQLTLPLDETFTGVYTEAVRNLYGMIVDIANAVDDPVLTRALLAMDSAAQARDRTGLQRGVGMAILSREEMDNSLHDKLLVFKGEQTAYWSSFKKYASPALLADHESDSKSAETQQAERLSQELLAALHTNTKPTFSSETWWDAITASIDGMSGLDVISEKEVLSRMDSLQRGMTIKFYSELGAGLVMLIILSVMMFIVMADVKRIIDLVRFVKGSSRELNDAMKVVHSSTSEASQMTDFQQSSLQQAAAAVEENTASIIEIKHLAQMVANSVENIRGASTNANTAMEKLSGNASEINKIIGIIQSIADQINLLALNAAIEAARAGDAGRGFAVVADEVRKLAVSTTQSTIEISSIVKSLGENVQLSATAMGSMTGALGSITEGVEKVNSSLGQQSAVMAELAASVSELSVKSSQMSSSMGGISDNANRTAVTSTQLASLTNTFKI